MPSDEPSDDESEWVRTWKANASAFDRVKSVTMTLSEPQPVSWIAEEAAVSPNTARDHLRRLIDLGVVTATETAGTRHYFPDPLYTRLRDVRELLQDTTREELSEQAAELKTDIAAWKREYDVDSPAALREQAASDGVSAEEAYERTRVASDWDLARYRLSLVQDAIENYDLWTADPSSLTA
ncbi:winged helix-turn-helix domain-containing protein [Halobaculum magnesiiphilum]|uniref:Winged helix-turn-helix domain-containing protein n=1 Tax=Halobaculum magnesiiphilum TaxID=1017351 RepID=A0A8T8WEF4_9EURY|nr:winged helix-turn-helix domain-containing protein [Halobaculum magnesiiphilum]QZP38225.1 winged helix-turn-helix domain-containing protein [Halobaculum magnesiiphilum]